MKPKISVVIPVYKVEQYLMQCIDSVLNQTMRDIEIILVDEGDNDPCYAIMLFYQKIDPRVRVFHQKAGGYGASVNIGIRHAEGEYISIIESDDFIDVDMFDVMYQRAVEERADVVKTPFYHFYDQLNGNKNLRYICEYADRLRSVSPEGAFHIRDYPHLMGVHASVWSAIYRTEYMRTNNILFVEARGAGYVDVEFRIRTLMEAERIVWLPKPFYNYRCTNMGSSTNKFNLKAMINRWKEAHSYLDGRAPADVNAVFPHLLADEYYNTYGYCFVPHWAKNITDAEFDGMKENMKWVAEDIIHSSPILNANDVQNLMLFRKATSIDALKKDGSPGGSLQPLQHSVSPHSLEGLIDGDLPMTVLEGDGVWRDLSFSFPDGLDARNIKFSILIIIDAGANCNMRFCLLCDSNALIDERGPDAEAAKLDDNVAERWFSLDLGVNYLVITSEMVTTLRGVPDVSSVRRIMLGGKNGNMRARALVGIADGSKIEVLTEDSSLTIAKELVPT